jgi:Transposase DDE domain group 1
METVSPNQLIFESLFKKEVIADFAGGFITLDADCLLLRVIDRRYPLTQRAAACSHDSCQDLEMRHDLLTLARQCLFAIAQCYEGNNDAATLARGPAKKIMAGKAPESSDDLAFSRRCPALRIGLPAKSYTGSQTGSTAFSYQAGTPAPPGSLPRRSLGANLRFAITNLSRNPQFVYDDLYVLRGDAENSIKEMKLELKADRLSCHRFLSNQFWLLLHTAPYCLFWLLRQHLQGTELATAQLNTLRLKLFKIGARIRETSRRIWVHLAPGYPYRDLLAEVLQNLRASPA